MSCRQVVTVVRCRLNHEASLRAALEGTGRLFNVQPACDRRGRYHGDIEVEQGRRVASAAASAGVLHGVHLSAGRRQPAGLAHFDNKLVIRQAFEDHGIPVTAVHPGPFMELMTSAAFAPALAAWGVEPRIVGWNFRCRGWPSKTSASEQQPS